MPEPNTHAEQSKRWHSYFVAYGCAADHLCWDDPYILSSGERSAIERSIQQFQLGEGSNGARLLKRGQQYSAAVGDPDFVQALSLFIQEEQRHSACLLRFMQKQGIPSVENHWVDNVFRLLRGLAGLELSLRVLVTAEIIAVPYYRALGGATHSALLRNISEMILRDEAAHLRFQRSMLFRIAEGRARVVHRAISAINRLFLKGTCHIVWVFHKSAFVASRYDFQKFVRESLSEFDALEIAVSTDCTDSLATETRKAAREAGNSVTVVEIAQKSP
jgi:hypothetical protein